MLDKRRLTLCGSRRPSLAAAVVGVQACVVIGLVVSRREEARALEPREAPAVYMGRTIAPTMSSSGADWLVRKSREAEENPAKLWNALQLKPGQTVCDFGCGNGYHTLELARRVGPTGLVYAVDIQAEMLDMLRERAEARGLANIRPVLATADDSGLPASSLDLVLMVDVYHELSDPAGVLATVRTALRRGGILALVEFRAEDPEVPILPLHKMSKRQVHRELTASNYELVREFDGLPWQHVLFYAPDDDTLEQSPKPWTKREESRPP